MKPTALVILDGFGHSPNTQSNAIALAKKPTLDALLATYPHTLLAASGKAVGLPEGYMGNSEVGHLTLGAGRIIPSPFLLLHTAIADGSFFTNPVLISHLDELAQSGKTLHIMGLLSDAGVQCHQELIYALIQAATTHKIKKIIVHAFLDGRDVAPKSAAHYLQALQDFNNNFSNAQLGSITGRYYAMDRDKDWDRTCAAFQMLTQKTEPLYTNWQTALADYYAKNITDEFVPPTLLEKDSVIENGDGVIFANFREDRARQLAECFIEPFQTCSSRKPFGSMEATRPNGDLSTRASRSGFDTTSSTHHRPSTSLADCPEQAKGESKEANGKGTSQPPVLAFFISSIRYDQHFKNPVLLQIKPIPNTLIEILSKAGKTIFSIAETEKYAHISYFFGGHQEQPFSHETRILIPSLILKTYIEHPEMSAQKITDAVIKSLQTDPKDFYLINYANADMVGHSGDLNATIKAVECLDAQIKQLYNIIVKKMQGTLIITADHGNAELKFDKMTGQPHTAHTTNPVPFIFVKNDPSATKTKLSLHGLADVAPFILRQMGVKF